ncbi:putative metalloprotease [Nocardia tenerifensis]|uniref:Putative metalloprotease n=1 Tax=Nocardia tenerifensis TaxID=228006 RepID=A0A318K0P2_9NOCA|nr:putative metalloprotease [Nocardia tenerifensis]
MSREGLRLGAVAVLVLFCAVLAGCGKDWQPRPEPRSGTPSTNTPSAETDWDVAGSATATGPSGPRKGVPDAPLTAHNGDGGRYDRLALNSIADLQAFWTAAYPRNFPGTFTPVSVFHSWDAAAPRKQAVEFCGESTYHVVNAAYCTDDHTIGWDRGVLLPAVVEKFGEMAVVMVLAHEYGHAVQGQARLGGMRTPTLVLEQQADCLAGVFLRHVAEGNSAHFTLNTTDGLNAVLGVTVAIRDEDPSDSKNAHGSAFERVTAVQIGYSDGAQACKSITTQQIAQRRGTLPVSFEPGEEFYQLPVTAESLNSVSQALAKIFPTSRKPQFDYSGVVRSCPNVTVTEPVSYCPSANKIGTAVPALAEHGAPHDDDPLTAAVNGDYSAFIIFVSRYVLAVQNDRKLGLTGAETAGLRTACLSGVVTTKLSEPGSDPRLSAGDLDEAVSELLGEGLAAGDVNGKVVPSGYQRVEAFRTGVLEGEQACLSRYK